MFPYTLACIRILCRKGILLQQLSIYHAPQSSRSIESNLFTSFSFRSRYSSDDALCKHIMSKTVTTGCRGCNLVFHYYFHVDGGSAYISSFSFNYTLRLNRPSDILATLCSSIFTRWLLLFKWPIPSEMKESIELNTSMNRAFKRRSF